MLRALGRAGLRYRVGCRRGGCGICKVRLVLGEVRYERPIAASVLTDDERVEGICLSCRAVPITNIVIELQEGDRLRRVLGFVYQECGDRFDHGRSAGRRDRCQQRNTDDRTERNEIQMSAVIRLGYVHLRVTDLEEARNHYSNTLGMEVVHEEAFAVTTLLAPWRPRARKAVPQVLGRVGPPLPGVGRGRRRSGQVRLQGRKRR